jgi:hypothetical protein
LRLGDQVTQSAEGDVVVSVLRRLGEDITKNQIRKPEEILADGNFQSRCKMMLMLSIVQAKPQPCSCELLR